MQANTFFTNLPLLLFLSVIIILPLKAQSNDEAGEAQKLTATLLHYDSLFWEAYNACDLDKLSTFFTDDLEFYHDKGGLTTPLNNFMESVENGLCGNENWRNCGRSQKDRIMRKGREQYQGYAFRFAKRAPVCIARSS